MGEWQGNRCSPGATLSGSAHKNAPTSTTAGRAGQIPFGIDMDRIGSGLRATALVVCQKASEHPHNHAVTLERIFWNISLSEWPQTVATLPIYFALEGIETTELKLTLTIYAPNNEIVHTSAITMMDLEETWACRLVELHNVVLWIEGLHTIRLVHEGALLMEKHFSVSGVREAQERGTSQ